MRNRHLRKTLLLAALACLPVGSVVLGADPPRQSVNGTVWVANRGTSTIRGFDAGTGIEVMTVAMAAGSQSGDLAYAKGRLYVAEEFGTPPAIAVVDPSTGLVLQRIPMALNARPHHVHASAGGNLVAVGLFGTDMVAIIDTHDDTLIGTWDINPLTTNGRAHAGVFSQNGHTLYVASDASNEVIALDPYTGHVFWRMSVPGAHELAVTHDGKTAYVSRRSANRLAVIDLEAHTFEDVLVLGLPDTLRLSANEQQLTVGLRTMPAQLAVVDTRTLDFDIVEIGPAGETATLAGHQWTSPSGRYTFATYEGGTRPGMAVIDHKQSNQILYTAPYPGRPHGIDHMPD